MEECTRDMAGELYGPIWGHTRTKQKKAQLIRDSLLQTTMSMKKISHNYYIGRQHI